MTERDRIIKGLGRRGFAPAQARTSKYLVFKRDDSTFYYVGKAGALRLGHTVAGSISVPMFRNVLLSEVL